MLSVGCKQKAESYNVTVKMSRVQFKIKWHIENQENHKLCGQ